MKYTIRDLGKLGISKTKVYEALKLPLPFSDTWDKNKRLFTEKDLSIFKHFKTVWVSETLRSFWMPKNINKTWSVETVNKTGFENNNKQSTNIENVIADELNIKINKLSEQFQQREQEYKKEIEVKNNAITEKENFNQKMGIQLSTEKKEKGEWIWKYENAQKKNSNLKMYSGMITVLFLVVSVFLYLLITKTVNYN